MYWGDLTDIIAYARVVILLRLFLLEQCLDPVFWTSIKTCDFVTFYKFLIHLGMHHTCRVGFLKRHMVHHAARFDGALVQVTHVFTSDPGSCDSAECRMYHHNRGCCLATIISSLPVVSSVKEEGKDNDNKEVAKRKRDG